MSKNNSQSKDFSLIQAPHLLKILHVFHQFQVLRVEPARHLVAVQQLPPHDQRSAEEKEKSK